MSDPSSFKLKNDKNDGACIGVLTPGYGMEKVSYALSPKGFWFKKIRRIPFHRVMPSSINLKSSFWNEVAIVLPNSVDLIHTFNTIPLNGNKFIVSFESEFPRLLGKIKKREFEICIKAIKSERCKAILALSERAAINAKLNFQEIGHPEIADRVAVFRGSVVPPACERTIAPGEHHGPLRLLMVGHALIRKGFIPVFEACHNLMKGGINVELTIVGDIDFESYVDKGLFWKRSVQKIKINDFSWMHHYASLPNIEIRKLMRNSDLLLFPSFDESLGWVAVEAGVEGLGVFATNIFALPELVIDNITGAICNLQLNRFSRWSGLLEELNNKQLIWDRDIDLITKKLEETIAMVDGSRDILGVWGRNAKKHIENLYGMNNQSKLLSTIYKNAIY